MYKNEHSPPHTPPPSPTSAAERASMLRLTRCEQKRQPLSEVFATACILERCHKHKDTGVPTDAAPISVSNNFACSCNVPDKLRVAYVFRIRPVGLVDEPTKCGYLADWSLYREPQPNDVDLSAPISGTRHVYLCKGVQYGECPDAAEFQEGMSATMRRDALYGRLYDVMLGHLFGLLCESPLAMEIVYQFLDCVPVTCRICEINAEKDEPTVQHNCGYAFFILSAIVSVLELCLILRMLLPLHRSPAASTSVSRCPRLAAPRATRRHPFRLLPFPRLSVSP